MEKSKLEALHLSLVSKNALYKLLGDGVGIVCNFVFMTYAARRLGADGFGVLGTTLLITELVGAGTELGLTTLVARDVARSDGGADRLVRNIVGLRLVLSPFVPLISLLGCMLFGYNANRLMVVAVMSLATSLILLSSIFNALFQGMQRLDIVSIGKVTESLGRLMLAVLVFQFTNSVLLLSGAYVVSNAVWLLIAAIIFAPRIANLKPLIEVEAWRSILAKSLPFWGSAALVLFSYRINPLLVSLLYGDETTGIYLATYKLRDVLGAIPLAVSSAVFPLFARYHQDSGNLRKIYDLALVAVFAIGLPLAVFVASQAEPIVLLVYGKDFINTVPVLRLFIWYILMIFLNWISGNLLLAIGDQDVVFCISLFEALANLGLGYTLIARRGYLGAAEAILVVELVVFVMFVWRIARHWFRPSHFLLVQCSKLMLGAILMGIVVILCSFLPVIAVAVIACLIYLPALMWVLQDLYGFQRFRSFVPWDDSER